MIKRRSHRKDHRQNHKLARIARSHKFSPSRNVLKVTGAGDSDILR
jgi:hypothetical protein